MRLLIAGWQGQIAQSLIEVAPLRADIEAFAVGRPALDICEVRTVERALNDVKPDVIINTAAYTGVDEAELEPERAMALNCEGARLLALSAARRGIPILHISTSYVFDGTSTKPYIDSDVATPITVYGKTKLAGEAAVQEANPKHIILRTAWVYSAYGRNFVKSLLQQARNGEPLRVVNDQFGSPTYAAHLVDAMLAIAARVSGTSQGAEALWGVYHAAGSGRASWYGMAREVLLNSDDVRHLADKVEAITSAEFSTRTPRPLNSQLDCTKLERAFGLRLPDWQEGVAQCVRRLKGE